MRPHSKYLMEYFAFLYDFAKMGDTECMFLIHTGSISTMVNFYMGQKAQENYVSDLGAVLVVGNIYEYYSYNSTKVKI